MVSQPILELQKINKEIFNLQNEHKETSDYITQNIKTVLGILLDFGFITSELELTPRGIIGTNIQETHSLVIAELFDRKKFNDLTAIELICVFSCFANVPIPEDRRSPNVWNKKIPEKAKLIIDKIFNFYNGRRRNYSTLPPSWSKRTYWSYCYLFRVQG